ncbi:MAG: 30S ribosomal protein S17 [Planctomycetaceae bacterium]|nr:30S ribosomal protein S17 [Planctomycetaceae bacterium]|tara:strand:- start:461 stop:877 length:417 start_codon:yes stop_codon:yes gene_type:complete
MPKKVAVGVVKSDKMDKTRRVEIARLVRHPLYGKYVGKQTVCYVHDEENVSNQGDLVEIIESVRRSRKKRWDLVRVVEQNTEVDVVALRAAQRQQQLDAEITGVGQVEEAPAEVEAEQATEAEAEAEAPAEEESNEEG